MQLQWIAIFFFFFFKEYIIFIAVSLGVHFQQFWLYMHFRWSYFWHKETSNSVHMCACKPILTIFLTLFRVKKKKSIFPLVAVCTFEEEVKWVNITGSTPSPPFVSQRPAANSFIKGSYFKLPFEPVINLCPWEDVAQWGVGNDWDIFYFLSEVKKKN